MRHKRIWATVSGAVLVGVVGAAAYAANPEQVTVEVEFVAPITISGTTALQFGLVDVSIGATETIIIAPDSSVTDAASRLLNNSQAAAEMTVGATAGEAINILVDNVNEGAGYTLDTFLCDYNGSGVPAACDGAGLNATAAGSALLTIGATLHGTGTAAVGVQNGTFDVTVAYQ
jgi:Domain of unknown function (DUF4402)